MSIPGYTDKLCPQCCTFTQHIIIERRRKWQCMNCDTVWEKGPPPAMHKIPIAVHPAPTTPLNLQLNVFYAPRIPAPPFKAFRAYESDELPDVYHVYGYDEQGDTVHLFTGHLLQTYQRLARHLRMDVAPPSTPDLCSDCPPVGYPSDATRCATCPRRAPSTP